MQSQQCAFLRSRLDQHVLELVSVDEQVSARLTTFLTVLVSGVADAEEEETPIVKTKVQCTLGLE